MTYKLFALLVGCRPPGRNTEQHDMFFTIAESLRDVIPALNNFWKNAGTIHIDGWREVTSVDGYNINVVLRESNKEVSTQTLFFINLGGYKQNEFEEFHYKILIVAENKATAIQHSKQNAFYKHTGYKGAESHIDDKFGVDADDVHAIDDILSTDIKENFKIVITKSDSTFEDELHMGYLPLSKLKIS